MRLPLSLRLEEVRAGGAPILGAIRLDILPSETVALTGPSGVGKSTLLRVISGLHTDYTGDVRRPERIATVFQEPTLLPWRSSLQNITLTTGCSRDTAMNWLAAVGLQDKADHFPTQLSLGQQRRLSLARAFAADPELLLLDEPFVSLDPALADEMMSLFESLRSTHQVTTLLVTHVESEARRLATRHLRLAGQPAHLT
ncbi:ABC transporter ATP-binding protein [Celeribacter litoreus]|uniref:ABC transporter ATP-binding protein n=1 Tax=Celeribacter litoreus TaxID=2876714 RepID=UPI001CCF6A01|nr:ATP-binding cassette domain-containing protein [Celeribacter litoreus]MCA0044443.1 ATP-binding cassette domain-containing protein [Celeribacter litoreus]